MRVIMIVALFVLAAGCKDKEYPPTQPIVPSDVTVTFDSIAISDELAKNLVYLDFKTPPGFYREALGIIRGEPRRSQPSPAFPAIVSVVSCTTYRQPTAIGGCAIRLEFTAKCLPHRRLRETSATIKDSFLKSTMGNVFTLYTLRIPSEYSPYTLPMLSG